MSARTASALAAVCGILALGAALAGALLPADEERARFAWPPANLAAKAPARGWYAPLPLLNRVPHSLEVRLPCGLSPSSIRRSPTVLSTTRARDDDTGLHIVQRERVMRVSLGSTHVAVPWPQACPLVVAAHDGRLQVGSRNERLALGTLDEMPVVTGLFSNLDLATGNPPRVDIETRPYGTSQTSLQIVLFVLAALLAGIALSLVVGRAGESRWRMFSGELRSLCQTRGATDAVVVSVTLIWWLVAPALYDDGWIQTYHRVSDDVGGFAYYFRTWGLNISLGYWFEWLRQPFVSSTDLAVARLPALLVVVLAWPLCRWCAMRVLSHPPEAPVRWCLAATFLVGVVAWEMTLRFEPVLCLLVLTALTAALAFVRNPGPTPLVVAGLAAALGVTAHPAGIVVLAPVIACGPEILRWLRRRQARRIGLATGLVTACAGVAITLFALDADLRARLSDSGVAREAETQSYSFWQEYLRYDQFDEDGGGPVVRHLSLALLILCVAALLTRGRAALTSPAALPARSVAVGLILLSFVPSKWPWHFGTLVAIGAVAAAAELAHLAHATFAGGRVVLTMNKIVGLAVVLAAMLWIWSENGSWNVFDLQELTWADVFNPWTQAATLVAIGLVAALTARRRELGAVAVDRFLRQFLLWTVPVFSFVAIGLTIGAIALDGARAPWSPLRQNIEAVTGDSDCGLAGRLAGSELARELSRSDTATLVSPPLVPYLPCVRQPDIVNGVMEAPRLMVLDRTLWPIGQATSPFAAFVDLYPIGDAATGLRGTRVLRVTPEVPGFERANAKRVNPT